MHNVLLNTINTLNKKKKLNFYVRFNNTIFLVLFFRRESFVTEFLSQNNRFFLNVWMYVCIATRYFGIATVLLFAHIIGQGGSSMREKAAEAQRWNARDPRRSLALCRPTTRASLSPVARRQPLQRAATFAALMRSVLAPVAHTARARLSVVCLRRRRYPLHLPPETGMVTRRLPRGLGLFCSLLSSGTVSAHLVRHSQVSGNLSLAHWHLLHSSNSHVHSNSLEAAGKNG